jgi:hypothetical protein
MTLGRHKTIFFSCLSELILFQESVAVLRLDKAIFRIFRPAQSGGWLTFRYRCPLHPLSIASSRQRPGYVLPIVLSL